MKKAIEKIYSNLGEMIFRMALTHLFNIGADKLLNSNIEADCADLISKWSEDLIWEMMEESGEIVEWTTEDPEGRHHAIKLGNMVWDAFWHNPSTSSIGDAQVTFNLSNGRKILFTWRQQNLLPQDQHFVALLLCSDAEEKNDCYKKTKGAIGKFSSNGWDDESLSYLVYTVLLFDQKNPVKF